MEKVENRRIEDGTLAPRWVVVECPGKRIYRYNMLQWKQLRASTSRAKLLLTHAKSGMENRPCQARL